MPHGHTGLPWAEGKSPQQQAARHLLIPLIRNQEETRGIFLSYQGAAAWTRGADWEELVLTPGTSANC